MKEGWEYKKLGEVADFCRGLTYKREDEVDSSDNCVLRSNNIDLESMSLNFEELKYIRPDFVIPEDKKLKANSVFVCMSNGSKQHVGKVAYVNEDMNYAFGGFMGLIVPKPQVRGKYIYYVCRSSLFRHFLDQIGNGIGITNLRFSDLNEFSIPFPPLSEQQHIVEELDLLSSIIEKKKAQLNELDNLAQSLFYEMFGDPIINEKGWEVKKLGEICNYSKTRIGSEELSIKNYVGVENLLQKCEGKIDAVKVPEGISLTEYIIGDVLIGNIRPYLKKIWLASYRGGCNGDVLVIRRLPVYQNTVNPIYLFKCLSDNAFFDYDMQFSKGEKMPRGDKKEILKYPILMPPTDLQNQFSSKVEAVEHQKELIKQSIKEVEMLFNSRMDHYFN